MQITNLNACPDWQALAQGVRLSWDSQDISDTDPEYWAELGPKDYDLLLKLTKMTASHRKFLRMAPIHLEVRAPLYWWKQFDTYKIGTVSLSESTMHTIMRPGSYGYALEDVEHIEPVAEPETALDALITDASLQLRSTLGTLNRLYKAYQETKDKRYFKQFVALLPQGLLQTRQVSLNYEAARTMYHDRKEHILDEWHEFCRFLEKLPYSEFITGD